MSDKWPDELERIRRQKQEECDRQDVQGKTAQERMQHIVDQWDGSIKSLLDDIAEATWADRGLSWEIKDAVATRGERGLTWKIKDWEPFPNTPICKIHWSAESDSLARDGFDVHLVVDVNAGYLPREFLVDCREKTLRAEPSLEALKAALLEAYKAGPRVLGALITGE